jgi:hypothetical protein
MMLVEAQEMNDIALTLTAAGHVSNIPRTVARPPFATLNLACTYLAFALSVAFTLAVVIGIVN